jgi:hypothetical protein
MWFAWVVAAVLIIFEKWSSNALYPYYWQICKEKQDERIRDIRTRKGVNNIFKTCYYLVAIIAGWFTLKDSFFLPASLGGAGSLWDNHKNWPYPELPKYYRLYFTGTMGYHIAGLV